MLLGCGAIYFGLKGRKQIKNIEYLRTKGKYIRANIDKIAFRTNMAGKESKVIEASWKDNSTGKIYEFRSVPFVLQLGFTINENGGVDVYFDPNDPKNYFVNLQSSVK